MDAAKIFYSAYDHPDSKELPGHNINSDKFENPDPYNTGFHSPHSLLSWSNQVI